MIFYRPDALSVTQPTVSRQWRKCARDKYAQSTANTPLPATEPYYVAIHVY